MGVKRGSVAVSQPKCPKFSCEVAVPARVTDIITAKLWNGMFGKRTLVKLLFLWCNRPGCQIIRSVHGHYDHVIQLYFHSKSLDRSFVKFGCVLLQQGSRLKQMRWYSVKLLLCKGFFLCIPCQPQARAPPPARGKFNHSGKKQYLVTPQMCFPSPSG